MDQTMSNAGIRHLIFRDLCALSLILVLAGCATGRDCRTPLGDAELTPDAALVAEGAVGRYQTWGGVLIETRNLEDSTELEIVGYPLNRCGRPVTTAGSVGRFILVQQGYQELADLKPGRKVSATGRIIGIRDGRVGKTLYRFPVLDGGLPRLWPEDRVDQSDRRPRFSIGIGGGNGWSGGGIGVWF